MCSRAHSRLCVSVCVCVCTRAPAVMACMRARVRVCMCACVCVCFCASVCLYAFIRTSVFQKKKKQHGSDSEHSYYSEVSEGGTRRTMRRKRIRDKDGKVIGHGKAEVYDSKSPAESVPWLLTLQAQPFSFQNI